MNFNYLDCESEKLLSNLLNSPDMPCSCGHPAVKILLDRGYVSGSVVLDNFEQHIFLIKNIEHKGRTYFEMKERYDREIEQKRAIVVNVGDGSPVNMNIGSGSANQNIDYASDNQLNALQGFSTLVHKSDELTAAQKEEILELIQGIKDNHKGGKKTILKSLLNCVEPLVATVKTLKDGWDVVTSFFS